MTLSAWRPLSAAPRTHVPVVVIGRGVPNVAIAFCDTADGCWRLRSNWEQLSEEGSDVIYAPIADTLELDRAVQVKVAEAFGQLIGALLLSAANRVIGNEAWADIQQSAAIQSLKQLHTAFGGRIPDEVP